jgi:hypothetical protein
MDDSPVVVLFNSDGYEVNVKNAVTLPTVPTGIIAAGSDGTNSRFIRVDSIGRPIVVGAGTAGTSSGGLITIQGDPAGTPVPITGFITVSELSVGLTGSPIPTSANQIGASDGTNLQVPRVFDLDTSGGTQYSLGVNLRLSSSGGSVEFGTTSNPIRIDPTGTTTQPVTGSGNFTVIQPTASNLNAQVQGSGANGAAVTGNPVLMAGSDGTNARTIKTLTDGTQITRYKELATFTGIATTTQVANNKSMFSIVNGSGSTVTVRISAIYITSVQTSAVTGVIGTFELRRIVNHSSGTAITAIESMSTGDSLNGSVTVRTNATVTSESTNLLWRSLFSTDEWAVNANLDTASHGHIMTTMFPIWKRADFDNKPIILGANEGLTVKFSTNSTVGSFDIMVVFTQE